MTYINDIFDARKYKNDDFVRKTSDSNQKLKADAKDTQRN